ncbi:MAG: xanthine dehydrogenase accessory protein XdhC [Chthoniobacterales bacterium]
MNSKSEVFRQLAAMNDAGTACTCVTLAGVQGSVPQEVGAKMVVTAAGRVCGTVGGGRLEDAAIRHGQNLLTNPIDAFEMVEWNLQRDIGMTCGGVVQMAFETFHSKVWTIAVFGAGHVAQALVRVLVPLNCRVLVFDTRTDLLAALPAATNVVGECVEPLQSAVDRIPEHASVVVMTQGHRTDKPILEMILKTRAFPYLGVIGSASKAAVLRRELRECGVPGGGEKAFRCPIGLPLGRDTPEEIAISIAAELIQQRDCG